MSHPIIFHSLPRPPLLSFIYRVYLEFNFTYRKKILPLPVTPSSSKLRTDLGFLIDQKQKDENKGRSFNSLVLFQKDFQYQIVSLTSRPLSFFRSIEGVFP